MSDWLWILWCVLGLSLIVAEVFTSGFVLLWFGIGVASAFADLICIDSLAVQFLTLQYFRPDSPLLPHNLVNYFTRAKPGKIAHLRGRTAVKIAGFFIEQVRLNEGASRLVSTCRLSAQVITT